MLKWWVDGCGIRLFKSWNEFVRGARVTWNELQDDRLVLIWQDSYSGLGQTLNWVVNHRRCWHWIWDHCTLHSLTIDSLLWECTLGCVALGLQLHSLGLCWFSICTCNVGTVSTNEWLWWRILINWDDSIMVTSALALHSGLHSLINYETDLIVVIQINAYLRMMVTAQIS